MQKLGADEHLERRKPPAPLGAITPAELDAAAALLVAARDVAARLDEEERAAPRPRQPDAGRDAAAQFGFGAAPLDAMGRLRFRLTCDDDFANSVRAAIVQTCGEDELLRCSLVDRAARPALYTALHRLARAVVGARDNETEWPAALFAIKSYLTEDDEAAIHDAKSNMVTSAKAGRVTALIVAREDALLDQGEAAIEFFDGDNVRAKTTWTKLRRHYKKKGWKLTHLDDNFNSNVLFKRSEVRWSIEHPLGSVIPE